MKILILTESSLDNGSARLRAGQLAPRLAERLGEVELSTPRIPPARGDGRVRRAAYFAAHAAWYGRRWLELRRRVRLADTILVQRAVYPLGPAAVTGPVTRFRGRVVLDLDDAIAAPHPNLLARGRGARWLYDAHQGRRLARRADAIVVSTRELAAALPGGRAAAAILPTVPDVATIVRAPRQEGTHLVVGWLGNAGNLPYLEAIEPALAALRADGLGELEVVSSEPWRTGRFRRWTQAEDLVAASRFGVGIMPLPDDPYTRAKAGYKLLHYMAAGIPVIASPVGVNVELVERSGAGYLADGPDEWEAALRRLALDPALRDRLGAAGRRFIEEYADLDVYADRLAAVLRGTP